MHTLNKFTLNEITCGPITVAQHEVDRSLEDLPSYSRTPIIALTSSQAVSRKRRVIVFVARAG